MTTTHILERVTRLAPLGVRFLDDVTGEVVCEGLSVTYARAGAVDPAEAAVNRSGVYVVRGLPGLQDVERGAGDDAFWSTTLPSVTTTIHVHDNLGRYFDMRFDAQAPTRGLFTPSCCSPPSPGVPLFSTPARIAPAGVAVARAHVVDAATGAPAAWAVLEAGGGRGVVDARGEVVVLFPYPPLASFAGSPPSSTRRPLLEERWSISLTARYDRLPPDVVPDLCDVLAQRRADASQSPSSPPQGVPPQTLAYGRELVVTGVLQLTPVP